MVQPTLYGQRHLEIVLLMAKLEVSWLGTTLCCMPVPWTDSDPLRFWNGTLRYQFRTFCPTIGDYWIGVKDYLFKLSPWAKAHHISICKPTTKFLHLQVNITIIFQFWYFLFRFLRLFKNRTESKQVKGDVHLLKGSESSNVMPRSWSRTFFETANV